MTQEPESFTIGNYYIHHQNGCLKVSMTDHKKSISILPSSGNSIVVVPVPAGSNQMKEVPDYSPANYTVKELDALWSGLGEVPFDDDPELCEMVLSEDYFIWVKGTPRDDIWHWFDERYPKGLGKHKF